MLTFGRISPRNIRQSFRQGDLDAEDNSSLDDLQPEAADFLLDYLN
jgi:hypothetical protein